MNKVSRAQCNNCTCSPGLLSRTNRRSSLMARQINLKRLGGSSGPNSRRNSVLSIDVSMLCAPEAKEINTSGRLASLRNLMKQYDLGVYIVPSEDAHQSEYVSSIDQKRSFISGFQGSAGVAVITRDVTCMNTIPEGLAVLSTDGRYFNQALNELDFNWSLLKQGAVNEPTWEQWSINQAIQLSLDSGLVINIGVDPKLITYHQYLNMKQAIVKAMVKTPKAKIELVPVEDNLVMKIWDQFESIPDSSNDAIKLLDVKYCGESFESKVTKVIGDIKENQGNALIITSLDEIAWFLNLRGNDIPYNPLFFSYLIINANKEVWLFVDNKKLDTKVQGYLQQQNIKVLGYESFWTEITKLSQEFESHKQKLLVPPSASWQVVRSLKCSFTQLSRSPIEDLKSIKNPTEIKGAISANLKDSRALCKFFSWLEDQLITKGEMLDEVQADSKLTEFKQQEEDFVGLSFSTISSTGANSAIIHYSPTSTNYSLINPDDIYLNDSGAHFLDGTTDTTRTIHLTTPSSLQCRNYTLVLKGLVSLSSSEFPENTLGSQLDSIARQHLWQYNLDYNHSTSHGIGSFLNVHEGPISIGLRPSAFSSSIKPGNILSNEPGYYEDGEYGIRLENVMVVVDSGKIYKGKKFYKFETLTRVPFCRKLINVAMLTVEEKAWINSYHKTIWKELSGSFAKNSIEYNWLYRETCPV